MVAYSDFIATKRLAVEPVGFEWSAERLPKAMKPHQRAVCAWAIRQGRGAAFLDTGLGKTLVSLGWGGAVAEHTGRPVLYICPLAVGPQAVREAGRFGVGGVHLAAQQSDLTGSGVYVTNYQKLHRFDPSAFGGVILGESSILKSFSGSTTRQLTEAFARTPYKLCETATPAPNDYTELGTHAEFLGVCSRTEMLATYFVHDSGDTSEWRLKGHARQDFWRWVASWAVVCRKPSDLGFPDEGYDLLPIEFHTHEIETRAQNGRLFTVAAANLNDQRAAKRSTLADRVKLAAEIVAREPEEPWLVWCDLNDEGDALEKALPGAVQVAGADSDDDKTGRMMGFSDGKFRVMVSKPKICGHGMNWQHCARVLFVGPSNSFEQMYQAIRRCWRYGQTRRVHVHLVASDLESAIVANYLRKQADHDRLMAEVVATTAAVNKSAFTSDSIRDRAEYRPRVKFQLPKWVA